MRLTAVKKDALQVITAKERFNAVKFSKAK